MLGFYVFAACFSLGVALSGRRAENRLERRLSRKAAARGSPGGSVLRGILKRLSAYAPGSEAAEKRLYRASRPLGLTSADFFALKAALAILVFFSMVAMGFVVPLFLVLSFAAAGAAYMLPEWWLNARLRQRASAIERDLLSFIDVLALSVEAGLPLQTAIKQVTAHLPGPLGDEFRKFQEDVDAGASRQQALRDLAERVDVNDVHTFVRTLVQAEKYGAPVGRVLREINTQFRELRRAGIEEKANKASVRIIFPVAAILMAIIALMMAPIFMSMGGAL